jgi:endo-1,4-beta-mannosidase
MIIESILNYVFIIAICLFLLSWSLNWVILNRINKTTYSPFRTNYSIGDFMPMMKHVAISEWKIWWKGEDFRELKGYSNLLSGALYFSTLLIFLLFVILKVKVGA